jgi:hypothetical protein
MLEFADQVSHLPPMVVKMDNHNAAILPDPSPYRGMP